jgi:hypothetical protein
MEACRLVISPKQSTEKSQDGKTSWANEQTTEWIFPPSIPLATWSQLSEIAWQLAWKYPSLVSWIQIAQTASEKSTMNGASCG